ncbi:MAG: peptidase C39 [Eubacteriales bacterium]|nr:peptidase C39 [Eubacteriales bacterium]
MKNILNYQSSEYDCGPTTLINAVRYLFDRETVTPELLKAISLYTLDSYNEEGESGKSGTSRMAMQFLASWMNQYGERKKFPIRARFLEEDQVYIGQNSEIVECLQQKGVAVVRVWLEKDPHYVLLTHAGQDEIGLFDPYYVDFGTCKERLWEERGFRVITDQPWRLNRMVKAAVMNAKGVADYGMGEKSMREAMLIYNTETRLTPEKTIEYII